MISQLSLRQNSNFGLYTLTKQSGDWATFSASNTTTPGALLTLAISAETEETKIYELENLWQRKRNNVCIRDHCCSLSPPVVKIPNITPTENGMSII